MSGFVESLGSVVARLWEGGQAFLWGCAGACALVFGLLVGGWHFGFVVAANALNEYGLLLLSGSLAFIALAIARTWQGWPKRTLFFVPNEEQSLWGHSRQTSGEVYTSFNFRMAVTNTADSAVHISKARIVWPLRMRFSEEVTSVLMTQQYESDYHGQDNAIAPRSRTHASGVIALNKSVCRAGKRLTIVVSVMDHRGRRHRVTFENVRATNPKPV